MRLGSRPHCCCEESTASVAFGEDIDATCNIYLSAEDSCSL